MSSELLTRAVSNVTPLELAEKKLASGKPIRMYWGIDPTGSRMHLGHAVPLRKMKAFADAGHEVIMLIGSFTAMTGDPTGRDAARTALTKEEVEANFETYKEQAAAILDFSTVQLAYNHEWLEPLGLKDLLELGSHFTVQQMLDRDMFQQRLKRDEPIYWNEFVYPLMVGYDSVVLDVDCELGGNDQLFNMLCGRKLQTVYGKKDKFVLTTKLLEGTDGRKMSKTYDNCIYLDDDANDMYGKCLSVNDNLMETYFECCTDVPMDEVAQILSENPRDAKARLAREIVTLYHGAEAAIKAEQEFTNVFKGGAIPEDTPEVEVAADRLLIEVLVEEGLISSKSDGRRLVDQNGIKVDDEPIHSHEELVKTGVVKVGKRKFLRVRVK